MLNYRYQKLLVSESWTTHDITVKYRTFQLLADLMNDFQQKILVTLVIVLGIPLISCVMATFIRNLQGDINYIILGLGALIVPNGLLVLLLLLGGMAQLYMESKKCLRCLSQYMKSIEKSRRDRKILLKHIQSFGIVKVKFGFQNFVDVLTPLNCIDETNFLTVQLLLLSK